MLLRQSGEQDGSHRPGDTRRHRSGGDERPEDEIVVDIVERRGLIGTGKSRTLARVTVARCPAKELASGQYQRVGRAGDDRKWIRKVERDRSRCADGHAGVGDGGLSQDVTGGDTGGIDRAEPEEPLVERILILGNRELRPHQRSAREGRKRLGLTTVVDGPKVDVAVANTPSVRPNNGSRRWRGRRRLLSAVGPCLRFFRRACRFRLCWRWLFCFGAGILTV